VPAGSAGAAASGTLAVPIVGSSAGRDAVSNVTARAAAVGVMATGEAEAEGDETAAAGFSLVKKVGDGELLYRGFMWARSLPPISPLALLQY
jgi:hypothetical protein